MVTNSFHDSDFDELVGVKVSGEIVNRAKVKALFTTHMDPLKDLKAIESNII